MEMETRRSKLALCLLSLAGLLLLAVACSTPASPYAPGVVNPTLRGTLDVAQVDVAATRIWEEAGQAADMTAGARQNDQATIAAQISGAQTSTRAAEVAAHWAEQTAIESDHRRQTAESADKTSTATAVMATATEGWHQTSTAVVHAQETEDWTKKQDALHWQQTADAATADARSTASSMQATAIALQQQIDHNQFMANVYTGAEIVLIVLAIAASAVGAWLLLRWLARRQKVMNLGNGQTVIADQVEVVLPDGRKVKRTVYVDPARSVGPVVPIDMEVRPPSERAQLMTTAQAQYTRGWIETAWAQAAALIGAARGGTGGQRRLPMPVDSSAPQAPDVHTVYTPPIPEVDQPPVIVIEKPEDLRMLVPPAQYAALQADWQKSDGDDDE